MKYLGPPEHDDYNTIRLIAMSKIVNSYPMLHEVLGEVEQQYHDYVLARGNAWHVKDPLNLSEKLSKALRMHYQTKPEDLGIIDTIRDEVSPDVCPMCGSPKPGQVDHVAPKETYPEYSFYTRNLVPACDCNGFKRLSFKGEQEGERVLHPYYDEVMKNRLVFVRFSSNFDSPEVELEVCALYRTDLAVNYHIDKILRKTKLLYWASAKWAAIRRNPESLFSALITFPGVVTEQIVRYAINVRIESEDVEHGTPNNWLSMVFYGVLLSPGATDYVTSRVNGLRAGIILPD